MSSDRCGAPHPTRIGDVNRCAQRWKLLDRQPGLERAIETLNDSGNLILQELERRANGQPTVIENDVQLEFHLHVYLELFRPWLVWECGQGSDVQQ